MLRVAAAVCKAANVFSVRDTQMFIVSYSKGEKGQEGLRNCFQPGDQTLSFEDKCHRHF